MHCNAGEFLNRGLPAGTPGSRRSCTSDCITQISENGLGPQGGQLYRDIQKRHGLLDSFPVVPVYVVVLYNLKFQMHLPTLTQLAGLARQSGRMPTWVETTEQTPLGETRDISLLLIGLCLIILNWSDSHLYPTRPGLFPLVVLIKQSLTPVSGAHTGS